MWDNLHSNPIDNQEHLRDHNVWRSGGDLCIHSHLHIHRHILDMDGDDCSYHTRAIQALMDHRSKHSFLSYPTLDFLHESNRAHVQSHFFPSIPGHFDSHRRQYILLHSAHTNTMIGNIHRHSSRPQRCQESFEV